MMLELKESWKREKKMQFSFFPQFQHKCTLNGVVTYFLACMFSSTVVTCPIASLTNVIDDYIKLTHLHKKLKHSVSFEFLFFLGSPTNIKDSIW